VERSADLVDQKSTVALERGLDHLVEVGEEVAQINAIHVEEIMPTDGSNLASPLMKRRNGI
jgi:hypothetical protein